MPITEGYCKEFDLDLKFGKMGEKFTEEVFEGKSLVETKTERDIWKTTGNIAIEYKYKGNPSGIAVTEAKGWAHVLADGDKTYCTLLFSTDKLKELARKHMDKKKNGGDNDDAEFVLLPLKEVFNGQT